MRAPLRLIGSGVERTESGVGEAATEAYVGAGEGEGVIVPAEAAGGGEDEGEGA